MYMHRILGYILLYMDYTGISVRLLQAATGDPEPEL